MRTLIEMREVPAGTRGLRSHATASGTLWLRILFPVISMLAVLAVSVDRAAAADAGPAPLAPQAALGERLYRQGISVDGTPVQASSQSDVPLSGKQAACVSCHRPSGMGSSEGGYYVPPINGPLLFAPRKLDRLRMFPQLFRQVQPSTFKSRLHQPHMRPGYTPASLATALRKGTDPAGEKLAAIMPRYRLTDADVSALDTYLHTLSAHTDPGVDEHDLQLATVVSDGVATAQRDATLATLQTYVKWHNVNLLGDRSRHDFSHYSHSAFVPTERTWNLSVWVLHGDESTWRAQLEAYYQSKPVFALVGGKVAGSWAGPAQFCDEQHLPCLFPDTDLPAWPPVKFGYTTYFSAGLALEAQVGASYIASREGRHAEVVQLAAADTFGQLPAKLFAQALHTGAPHASQRLVTYQNRAQLDAALKDASKHADTLLVVWPGQDVSETVDALQSAQPQVSQVLLPSRAIDAAKARASSALTDRLRFVDPYELKPTSHAKSFDTRAWMRTRRLVVDHPLLQFKQYYAMTMLNAALFEISNDFYRDYLIERIENESQKDMNPGMYPRLALGPGERYAAKGAAIMRLAPKEPAGLVPASDWITP